MMSGQKHRVVAISGPSCGGKTPLLDALEQFHADPRFVRLGVIKSKESRGGDPRPDETGIWNDPNYFRPRAEIESLSGERYVHAVSHGFPQVLDLDRIVSAPTDLVVVEACQEITRQLPCSGYLRGAEVTTVFVSPLAARDIVHLRSCGVNVVEYLKGLNVCRLLRRAAFHGRDIDDDFLADVALRAGDGIEEIRRAHLFDVVLISRAGEGTRDWNRTPGGTFLGRPVGDAGATLDTFVNLLKGSHVSALEKWTASIL